MQVVPQQKDGARGMSKDAELLRAIGMGPETAPELWANLCPVCGGSVMVFTESREAACVFGRPKMGPRVECKWRGMEAELMLLLRFSLGLDVRESEWTAEHDANFARWVWPWLRRQDYNLRRVVFQQLPDGVDDHPLLDWFERDHPGPTMCRAIHAVVCGGESK